MTLLDTAFSFFANFPCRLAVSELKFDLPCEEFIYASTHPFADPKFTTSRHLSVYEAFQSLFSNQKLAAVPNQGRKGNPLGLNPMDMFILIHRMISLPWLLPVWQRTNWLMVRRSLIPLYPDPYYGLLTLHSS